MLILWSLKKTNWRTDRIGHKMQLYWSGTFCQIPGKARTERFGRQGRACGFDGDWRSPLVYHDENEIVPVPGRLIYRGIDIFDLVDGFISEGRFGLKKLHICCFSVICRPGNSWMNLKSFFLPIANFRKSFSMIWFWIFRARTSWMSWQEACLPITLMTAIRMILRSKCFKAVHAFDWEHAYNCRLCLPGNGSLLWQKSLVIHPQGPS